MVLWKGKLLRSIKKSNNLAFPFGTEKSFRTGLWKLGNGSVLLCSLVLTASMLCPVKKWNELFHLKMNQITHTHAIKCNVTKCIYVPLTTSKRNSRDIGNVILNYNLKMFGRDFWSKLSLFSEAIIIWMMNITNDHYTHWTSSSVGYPYVLLHTWWTR